MSRLDELILELCPNGVEYKQLKDLGVFYGGLTGKSKDDFENGNKIFITYKNVYSNPSLDLHPAERVKIGETENQRTLKYGDVIFTGSSETPDECGISSVVTEIPQDDLYLNSFCFIFRFDDLNGIYPPFMKHLFRSSSIRKQIGRTANGVTRYNVSKKLMSKISIPIPPMEIQKEIVRLLDEFTAKTAELQDKLNKELEARKKQYEYYRDSLFSDKLNDLSLELCPNGVQYCELKEIADISTGSHNTNEGVENGMYPFYVRSQEPLTLNSYDYDETAIITAGDGVGVGKVFHFVNGKYALHQRAYRIHANTTKVEDKFLYYYFCTNFMKYIEKTMFKGSVPSIRRPMLIAFKIPVPPLEIQQKIVRLLDDFTAKTTKLQDNLNEELEACKKQYEFYRDKLLTFKELNESEVN